MVQNNTWYLVYRSACPHSDTTYSESLLTVTFLGPNFDHSFQKSPDRVTLIYIDTFPLFQVCYSKQADMYHAEAQDVTQEIEGK